MTPGNWTPAARFTTPVWYHPILALLIAGYVVGFTFAASRVQSLVLIAFLACLAALVQAYRRRTGVWISGFGAGRASRWAYALSALIVLAFAAAKISYEAADLRWPAWVAAAGVAIGTIVLGHKFDLALRKQIRQGR